MNERNQQSPLVTLLKRLLVFLFALSTVLVVASWWVAGRLLLPSQQTIHAIPSDLPIENLSIESSNASLLAGWYIENPDSAATVLLFHPVRSNREKMLQRAKFCFQQGYDVLMIDFQAHGESQGERVSFGHLEKQDVNAALMYALSRRPEHRIGIVGWSLGGAATLLAQPKSVDAIVLEAVYPDIRSAISNRIRLRWGTLHHLLTPLLVLQVKPRLGISIEALRPISVIGKLKCPLLIVAGDCDEHTTIEETRALHDAATAPKKLLVFEGAKHQDLMRYDSKLYQAEIGEFFRQHLGPRPP